ncbi:MAG TPA: DNA alkylation repair protein [Lapillicoccus sp.]|nr:DNA alkylation repair protein [Lapillicoccus sp.]
MHRDLVDTIRAELARHADPARAAGQQRYMKSTIPYRGLTSPQLTAVLRPILADPGFRIADRDGWEATIRTLWDEVAYREEWYAAIALARHRTYRPWVDSESMPLWRHLVVTGAWWDVVDEVATQLVRDVLEGSPDVEGLRLREWAVDDDLWLRRTAIICQVGRKDRLDESLLADAIEPNLADRDFFLRKAIGWALRDHARIAPDWVRAFVDAHAGELSGLSRREATRHLADA